MAVNDRITTYINSLEPDRGVLFSAMEEYARQHFVPIIKPETGSLLRTLVEAKAPKHVLEVGTAIGYSALLMSLSMPAGGRITTIEKFTKRIPVARDNIRQAGKEDVITLIPGDADEILPRLSGPFEFIFMDAAKGQYLHWLPVLLELLPKGGILVSDNVLQDGDILESRYAITRRNRTIHSRIREYLHTIMHMEEFQTSVLPVGDGVTISVKITE